ncbi:MAG: helix-turn-helix transcriptional regulator [Phycisphaerales bacterium]|nr:helix-turn-helix transcriptional regulator [Phycisphaerales bacterium]
MDAVFLALGNATRRRILDIVKASPGCNVNDICAYFEISRIAVMKHLHALEDAKLLTSEKRGRDRRLYFNAVPIRMIYDRWTTEFSSLWAERLTRIKYAVEGASETRPAETKPSTRGSIKAEKQAKRGKRKRDG